MSLWGPKRLLVVMLHRSRRPPSMTGTALVPNNVECTAWLLLERVSLGCPAGSMSPPDVIVVCCLQYKTGEVASRCGDLIRVNVYKDKIKNASLPPLPNDRALVAALTKDYSMLATMGEDKARNRPIYSVTDSQRGASERFLRVSISPCLLLSFCGIFPAVWE